MSFKPKFENWESFLGYTKNKIDTQKHEAACQDVSDSNLVA